MNKINTFLIVTSILMMIFYNDVLSNDKWTHYKEINGKLYSIKQIEIDNSDKVYFVAIGEGLFMLNNDNIINLTNYEYSENNYNISKLEFSKSNILWGASENGFMKYHPNENSLKIFNRKEIIGDWDYEYIISLALNDESVWFVSRNPYLSVFNGTEFIDFDISWENKIIDLHLNKAPLIIDKNQDIWLGGQDGILRFSSKSTQEDMIYTKFSLSEIGFAGKVESLIEDDFGNIYASGSINGEISIFMNGSWSPIQIPEEFKSTEILNDVQHNYIALLGKDNDKNIKLFWQIENYYLSIDSNLSFSKIQFPKEIIPTKTKISSFKCDSKNNLWFGTLEDGLIKYSPSPVSVKDNEIMVNNVIPEVYIRNIFPNPTIGRVSAELVIYPERLEELNISLYNYLGYKVMELTHLVQINEKTGDANIVFNIENLNLGVYYFVIKKGKDKFVKLLAKIH